MLILMTRHALTAAARDGCCWIQKIQQHPSGGAALSAIATIALLTACSPAPTITSFEDCAAAGHPVMESYPRQCVVPGGATFTKDIGNALEKENLIRATAPRPGDLVSGTITIEGEARGTWYFEASFPVRIVDETGNVLVQHYAQAQGEWMTEDFVPFRALLTIPPTTATKGTLILEKDNPSGLPEHADELRIPVWFK